MGRKSKQLKLKPMIAVFCEGESEQAYFEMLKQKYHASNVRTERITIKALHLNGLALLKKAKARRDALQRSKLVEQAYVVFDRDALREADLLACAKYAKQEALTIIFSSVNFEVWILMHFEPVRRHYTAAELVRVLSGERYFNLEYQQFKGSDYTDYLVDRVRMAELHAENLRITQSGAWYRRDPYTQVDLAVVEIFGISER